ncbi:MAG: GAF domain-containing sensor histidine kinase [Gemmatimonadota bacterium]|jgi:signal transduction histidine kinase
MDLSVPSPALTELAAAYLQLAVTVGLVVLCAVLYRRYGKEYFGLWALAWAVYGLRLLAIVTFLVTGSAGWLFWHQVVTGWTALALLWAALVFSQRTVWKRRYLAVALFPVVWSYVAIYVLDSFAWAAGPMVAFLSLTTAWTAWAFFRYDRLVRSPAARFLTGVLVLWALHHLDYPFLRAQGLRTLTALSAELQPRPGHEETMTEAMLRRALSLRGVHGSALWLTEPDGGAFVQGSGLSALWPFEGSPEVASRSARRVCRAGIPQVVTGPAREHSSLGSYHAYTAALPVLGDDEVVGALVVVGEARDPFTVLDNRFLLAFGHQVGAALANEDLRRSLETRKEELERLQARMVHQHEEERNRLWRELHDETAQVLAALNMQLGLLEERAGPELGSALDRARTLVGEGIKSIRSVTRNLRPMALDDLGLLPALRALARDFDEEDAFHVSFDAPDSIRGLSADAEVALYRSLQEALANAARHGSAHNVRVSLEAAPAAAVLTVTDDGTGFPEDTASRLRSRGGLAGIRERISALGGDLHLGSGDSGGAQVRVSVPRRNVTSTPEIPQEVTT